MKNITLKELVPYNNDEDTFKNIIVFNGEDFGILTGTGHPMAPIEFVTTNSSLLLKVLKYLKTLVIDDDCNSSIIENKFFSDTELVYEIKDEKLIFKDEDLVPYFWNDISSLI